MPKILIVEDQVLTANYIKNILIDNNWNNVKLAYKINEATEILKSFKPEIILLDINVQGKNSGIEWAKEHLNDEKIIYITGQTEIETLQGALTTNPIAYLTKPVKTIDLVAAITLLNSNLNTNYIIIKDGYNDVKINYNEILFIRSDKNYIDIQTLSKKYSIRNTLDDFLEQLNSEIFQRVHRSYIVNTTKITSIKTSVVIIDSFEIPITRSLDLNL